MHIILEASQNQVRGEELGARVRDRDRLPAPRRRRGDAPAAGAAPGAPELAGVRGERAECSISTSF